MATMPIAELRQRISTHMPGTEGEAIVKAFENTYDELATFKASFNALVTKLNADAVEQNAKAAFPLTLDTNYAPIP